VLRQLQPHSVIVVGHQGQERIDTVLVDEALRMNQALRRPAKVFDEWRP